MSANLYNPRILQAIIADAGDKFPELLDKPITIYEPETGRTWALAEVQVASPGFLNRPGTQLLTFCLAEVHDVETKRGPDVPNMINQPVRPSGEMLPAKMKRPR